MSVTQLHKKENPKEHFPFHHFNIRYDRIFEDSNSQMMSKTANQFKHGRQNVGLFGRRASMQGGIARE